jgi:hypothetical protein
MGLVNARGRIQRLKDAQFISFWVAGIDEEGLILELAETTSVEPGDLCLVEINGFERTAVCRGMMMTCADTLWTLQFHEQIRFVTQREPARYRVQDQTANVGVLGFNCEVPILDVAQDGFAIASPFPIEKGTVLDNEIPIKGERLLCQGDSRYCRSLPDDNSQFRVGIVLRELTRLDHVRWNKLLNETTQAAA